MSNGAIRDDMTLQVASYRLASAIVVRYAWYLDLGQDRQAESRNAKTPDGSHGLTSLLV